MNKIVAIFELPGMTQQNYDDILVELSNSGGIHQPERPSHTSFQKGDHWCVIDVWESAEALMEFGQNRLGPIFAKLGIPPPEPQIFPIHNFIGVGKEDMVAH